MSASEILTDDEREVLTDLRWLADTYADDDAGFAPLRFGGSNGSHHGATATKLAKRGLVKRRYRGYGWGEPKRLRHRGSCLYAITDAGREALRQAARKASDQSQEGGK